MKTAFTFKGFEVTAKSVDDGKDVYMKLDEISVEVSDLEFKDYAQFILQFPKMQREITDTILSAMKRGGDIELERRRKEREFNEYKSTPYDDEEDSKIDAYEEGLVHEHNDDEPLFQD